MGVAVEPMDPGHIEIACGPVVTAHAHDYASKPTEAARAASVVLLRRLAVLALQCGQLKQRSVLDRDMRVLRKTQGLMMRERGGVACSSGVCG